MIESGSSKVDQLVFRMPKVRALRLPLSIPRPKNPLSSTLLLAYGFTTLIILGTLLLILPASSTSGHFTSPINALFTATSAACVTGLVVVDTGTYWSTFGQAVLLGLFQIGGLGFIIGATLLLLAIGGRFGLKERLFITESMGLEQFGDILGIIVKAAIFSFFVEAIGVVIFYFHWLSIGDPTISLWTAIFHAVSAFNNSGMDILGNFGSLSIYQGDAVVLLITALLIIFGSTGYFVFADLARNRSFVKLSFDSKIVLVTTCSLLVIGTLFYLVAEFSSPATLGPLPFSQKMLGAIFQSATTRTAGFSTFNTGGLSQISLFFTMFLMCIGGATGSVAGGVKVNTLGVLAMTILSSVRGKDNIEAFGRQLTKQTVYRALTLLLLYLGIASIIVVTLSITEVFPFDNILFETFSALGTVGLTTGITPDLSVPGRFIIIAAMFIGRLGPLSLMVFLNQRHPSADLEYPHETMRLG